MTFLEKYGVDWNFKIPEVINHRKNYFLEKYGVDIPSKSAEVSKKIKEAWDNKSNEEKSEILSKKHKKYKFQNISFDSWPEVCLYIYLQTFEIPFIYQPIANFTYNVLGKTFKYFPDFLIGDTFVEIKGSHFFNKEEGFIDPYKKDDSFAQMKAKAKFKCMQDNNIIILKSEDYQFYLDFAKSLGFNPKGFKNK